MRKIPLKMTVFAYSQLYRDTDAQKLGLDIRVIA